jgi:hypothetical protein
MQTIASQGGFENMSTLKAYLNDYRIINDPEMAAALEPLREAHAKRLMLQDEWAGKTTSDINHIAETSLAKHGLQLCYDLTGQGRR